MAWWRRCPPQQPERVKTEEDLDQALDEASRALWKAHAQNIEQRSMCDILRAIREENHLSEIWGDQGMRA